MSLSKVIKGRDASVGAGPLVFELLGASGRAASEALAREEKEKTVTDLLAFEKEAYEKGFAAGEKAGFELGVKKAEVLFNGLARLFEELKTYKESLYAPCEKEMAELSLAIAKKVIQREVEKQDSVLDCVRMAVKSVVAAGEIVIKVNPRDLEVLNNYRAELSKFSGIGAKGLKIESDAEIGKGGCVIETNYGEVDATVGSILGDIEERLRNA